MPKYRHTFHINASLKAVSDFHSRAESMEAITPPPIKVEFHQVPSPLSEGDEMDFSLWFGVWAIRWLARIEEKSGTGFVDRQVKGPFEKWSHRHTFVPLDDNTTQVIDEIELTLASHWGWKMIGLGMWQTLPFLFAYRAWKTKQLLQPKGAGITIPVKPIFFILLSVLLGWGFIKLFRPRS